MASPTQVSPDSDPAVPDEEGQEVREEPEPVNEHPEQQAGNLKEVIQDFQLLEDKLFLLDERMSLALKRLTTQTHENNRRGMHQDTLLMDNLRSFQDNIQARLTIPSGQAGPHAYHLPGLSHNRLFINEHLGWTKFRPFYTQWARAHHWSDQTARTNLPFHFAEIESFLLVTDIPTQPSPDCETLEQLLGKYDQRFLPPALLTTRHNIWLASRQEPEESLAHWHQRNYFLYLEGERPHETMATHHFLTGLRDDCLYQTLRSQASTTYDETLRHAQRTYGIQYARRCWTKLHRPTEEEEDAQGREEPVTCSQASCRLYHALHPPHEAAPPNTPTAACPQAEVQVRTHPEVQGHLEDSVQDLRQYISQQQVQLDALCSKVHELMMAAPAAEGPHPRHH